METMIKKYQQKFKKAKDEMSKWDDLQSRLISHFRNASSIISRLQFKLCWRNGSCSDAKADGFFANHFTFHEKYNIFREDFRGVVLSLAKLQHDGKQLAKGSSNQMNKKQLQHRIGVKPTLTNCIDGLVLLHEIYHDEYLLKSSLVSALSALALKPNSGNLGALHQLLADQPNILNEEVQYIFDIVFAEEIC
ncbi:uncharacterized protein At5g43822 isoform X3 [Gossypium hirsutum]|uniref:Uncharacterized protein At5g43822 isoform X3 n=1 Tax=Gossypium hirsutum TaxID=3635 RepID=A0ABM2YT93_GOSHI|nr:uncharacterized protein At5g43822-like isoform X3 [Gossypium hirsutum]